MEIIYTPNNEHIRSQNYISGKSRNPNKRRQSAFTPDIMAEESGRIDTSQIQRRITLRPAMTTFPYPPSYINSFYKYKAVDYNIASTNKPSFKKTTRENLWGPNSSSNQNNPSTTPTTTGSVSATVKKVDNPLIKESSEIETAGKKPSTTVYVTGRRLIKPSKSAISTSVQSSVTSSTKPKPTTYTHLEIVTSRSTSIDGEVVPNSDESLELSDSPPPTILYNSRYGIGALSNEVSTNHPSIIFDDERNNVGGEVEVEETTITPTSDKDKFFEGNGIRRPDTNSVGVTDKIENEATTIFPALSKGNRNREMSQSHSPASMMKLYQFQRGKSPVNWSRNGKSVSTTIIANTSSGPAKIGLGPRLKFNLKRY